VEKASEQTSLASNSPPTLLANIFSVAISLSSNYLVIVQLLFLHESHCSPTTRIVSRRAVRIRTENNGGHSLGTQQGTPLKTSTCRYISTTTLADFIESILCLHVCHLNISRGMERYLELREFGAAKISCNLSRILIPHCSGR
jgi:hypothetical protein